MSSYVITRANLGVSPPLEVKIDLKLSLKISIIKFDAETWEMEVLGRKETYGTVFWNCPLRSWDSRFTLQARKILNVEEPAFRSLADSLFIP